MTPQKKQEIKSTLAACKDEEKIRVKKKTVQNLTRKYEKREGGGDQNTKLRIKRCT